MERTEVRGSGKQRIKSVMQGKNIIAFDSNVAVGILLCILV